jgi:hypothetical protein
MQVRYRDLIRRLAQEFPEAPPNYWPQTLTRWKAALRIQQPRPGWYDEEDYVGLCALGEAYRRHQLRGQDATDYALSKVRNWKNGHQY